MTNDFTIAEEEIRIWGGFHHVPPILILWNCNDGISKNQYIRIQKHFCGRSNCSCGGAFKDLEISDQKLKDAFLDHLEVARFLYSPK